MKKTYAELLKDPRWQKRRLEILSRDGFACQSCSNKTETLHVHHIRYDYENPPWESSEDNLITLCESCHKAWHYLYDSKICSAALSLVVRLADKLEQQDIKRFFKHRVDE